MTSLVRVHDSASGLAIKQGFSYRSRVVGSELFAYSFSLAVIIGVGPPRAHVTDSQCIRSVALKMGTADGLIWFTATVPMAAVALSERLRFMELFRLAVSILRKDWERSLARSPQPFTPLSCRSEGGATDSEAVDNLCRLNISYGQKFYELMRESFPERSLRPRLQTFDPPPPESPCRAAPVNRPWFRDSLDRQLRGTQ